MIAGNNLLPAYAYTGIYDVQKKAEFNFAPQTPIHNLHEIQTAELEDDRRAVQHHWSVRCQVSGVSCEV